MSGRHPRVDTTRGELALGTIQNGEKRAPVQLTNDGALEVDVRIDSSLVIELRETNNLLHSLLHEQQITNLLLKGIGQ